MTAAELKTKLAGRYAAMQSLNGVFVPGGWTCIEEYRGIDVVAFSAHSSPKPSMGVTYPRVGHEVKVSRSDYRRELLAPHKRTRNVEWCNAFFFVVPAGLLKPVEVAWEEPEWEGSDFMRTPCPEHNRTCWKGKADQRFIGPLKENAWRWTEHVTCPACEGRGYMEKSRVELQAPTLWVPRDVGLITVDGRGCRVVKKSPIRKEVPDLMAGSHLNDLVRWISVRPDSRHAGFRR